MQPQNSSQGIPMAGDRIGVASKRSAEVSGTLWRKRKRPSRLATFGRPSRLTTFGRPSRLTISSLAWLFLAFYLPRVTSLSNQYKNGYVPAEKSPPLSNVISQVKRSPLINSNEANATVATTSQPNNLYSHLQTAHRPRLRAEQERSYQHLVVFAFTATLNNGGQHAISISDRAHVIAMQRGDRLKLTCLARLFGIGEDLAVQWWRDGQVIAGSNSTIIINENTDQMGTFRCIAEVVSFSTDLFSSYFFSRAKRDTDMPSGKLLSTAIVVKRAAPVAIVSHPQSKIAESRTCIRLECATNSADPPRHPIRWFRNDLPLNNHLIDNRYKISTINTLSVLHIVDTRVNDSGFYFCECGAQRSDVANVTVLPEARTVQNEDDEKFVLVQQLPVTSWVKVGESTILECLFTDPSITVSWTATSAYGQPISIDYDSSSQNNQPTTALRILNASEDVDGTYTCHAALNGEIRKFSTLLTVRVPPLLQADFLVSRITRTQGTTTRFECTVTNDPHDQSLDIGWYKDGVKIRPFALIKLLPVEGYLREMVDYKGVATVEFSKHLLISSVQQDNRGLYQCIVTNMIGEQTSVVGLSVEADFDGRITDLQVSTDHENAQFDLLWKLPANIDHVQAQGARFLLNYYLTNGGHSNTVALNNVLCTANNECIAKCCSSNYAFVPRSNYTFQMSTLYSNNISPLSEPSTVISWDGVAKRALDLFVSSPKSDIISIRWRHPSQEISNGVVKSYSIDYFKVPMASSGEPSTSRTENVGANITHFEITGVRPREMYRFRVIPSTRFGSPSNILLKSNANFTLIAHIVDSVSKGYNPALNSPILDIKQNNESSLEITWTNESVGESTDSDTDQHTTILLKYARSSSVSLREKAVEAPYNNFRMTLNDRFDPGHLYQFCGRLYLGAEHGADYCIIFRTTPKSLKDIFGDVASRTKLPKPVRCDYAEGNASRCHCEQSHEFGDAMRVVWNWPEDDDTADEFAVHFTLDENDIEEDNRMVITDELFADLPSLKSGTTYRVMIEARNKAGGVEGIWFNCTTPTLMQIPAPSDVTYTKLNETAFEVKWSTVDANPQWSTPMGYVIQVQTSSTSAITSNIPVDGLTRVQHVLTVQPNVFYTVRVAARANNGEVGLRSPPYLLTTSRRGSGSGIAAKANAGINTGDEKRKRRMFLSKSYKEAFLIAAVVLVGLLTICFAIICAHFRLKRRKLQMGLNGSMQVARSNANYMARSRACEMEGLLLTRRGGCDRAESGSLAAAHRADIQETELQFDSARSSLAECRLSLVEPASLDTKGGELGTLPSGRDKYEKLLTDEKLLRRLREAGLTSTLTTPRGSRMKQSSMTPPHTIRMKADERMAMFRDGNRRPQINESSESKNLRTTPRNHMRLITDSSARRRNYRHQHNASSRSSNESSAGESVVVPCILSRLAALPDLAWPTAYTNTVQPYPQGTPLSCIIAPQSSFARSNSCHLDEMRDRQSDTRTRIAMLSSYMAQSPYNTISLQSLMFENGNNPSLVNECERLHREMMNNHNATVASSSMPNLTDSGIVYDEQHQATHQQLIT